MAELLRKNGELPSCEKVGQEFEVSYKTVSRDIDLLRDFMGYPIAYDKSTYKWKQTSVLQLRLRICNHTLAGRN
jgi:predicted DNA-binding transcriptional regulator YafY